MESKKYVIAGLKVRMAVKGVRTLTQSEAYLCDFEGEPDIIVEPTEENVEKLRQNNPDLDYSDMEYLLSGWIFYYKFLNYGGMELHSSCVVSDGKAYLFSAQSGTGKSTHTEQWMKYIKDAFILNDDKPAIRCEDDGIYAYGTPWSGKTDQNVNARYPIGAIAFLERSEKCFIEPMDSSNAAPNLYWQTVQPRKVEGVDKLFSLCDKIIRNIPIYRFGCDISEEAVKTSYEKMTGKKYN